MQFLIDYTKKLEDKTRETSEELDEVIKEVEKLRVKGKRKRPNPGDLENQPKKRKDEILWREGNEKEFLDHLKEKLVSYEDYLKNYQQIEEFDSGKEYDAREVTKQFELNKTRFFGDCIRYGQIMRKVKMNFDNKNKWVDFLKEIGKTGEKQTERYIKLADLAKFPLFFRLRYSMKILAPIAEKIFTYLQINKVEGEIWKDIKWKE